MGYRDNPRPDLSAFALYPQGVEGVRIAPNGQNVTCPMANQNLVSGPEQMQGALGRIKFHDLGQIIQIESFPSKQQIEGIAATDPKGQVGLGNALTSRQRSES